MFRKLACFAVLMVANLPPAKAEIVKSAVVDCDKNQLCFYWWPKPPAVPGWHTDEKANHAVGANGVNTLIPDGFGFQNADAIIYAAATHRQRYAAQHPNISSLDEFIEDDKAVFAEKHKDIAIAEVDPLTTADGQKLRSFTFFRPKDKNWERVSYGQEGDFYLVFTLNAQSEAGYRANQAVYEDVVRRYSSAP